MSISFPLDKKPTVVPGGSAGEAVGRGAKGFLGLALAGGVRLLRSFGIDRIAAPGSAAGRGRASPDG